MEATDKILVGVQTVLQEALEAAQALKIILEGLLLQVKSGGNGGGGDSGDANNNAQAGTPNTGGGGGGSGDLTSATGGAGGSGVVILRTTSTAGSTTGSPTITQDGSYNVYKFTADGSITF